MMPIGADAAAIRGEPYIFVPGADDAVEVVRHGIQEAGDGQAALGAAIGEHRRRGHEPQSRHIVVDALAMRLIVGIGLGDAGEHVLIGLARQQIAVAQRGLAELGQQCVAPVIDTDLARDDLDRRRFLGRLDRSWLDISDGGRRENGNRLTHSRHDENFPVVPSGPLSFRPYIFDPYAAPGVPSFQTPETKRPCPAEAGFSRIN